MKKLALSFLFVAGILAAADIDGKWRFNIISFGEEVAHARLELKVAGTKLSGTLNELKIEGTAQGDTLKFTATRPNGEKFGDFEGHLAGPELAGSATRPNNEKFDWIARRVVIVHAAPQTRDFEPAKFHRFFSGTIEPALHINPGDTVRTHTVDAGGRDATGTRRSNGGNPETGPFYVEGAMPGDTLVIKFNRIRLNRDSAESGDRIVGGALDPDYIEGAKYDDKFSSEWKLDREQGFAMLAKPSEHLKNFRCGRCWDASRWRLLKSKLFAPDGSASGAATWITTDCAKGSHSTCPFIRKARFYSLAMATLCKATANSPATRSRLPWMLSSP